jgi:acyl carrier protein
VNEEEIRTLVTGQLRRIAPELDVAQLDPEIDLREQVDFDSMDILNLAVAIHEATGVDIPEADYPLMVSLNGCVRYLRTRLK